MIIYHCADLHLDSELKTHLTKEQAAERNTELVNTFYKMIDNAKQEKAKVILISGDLFDTNKTKHRTIKKNIVLKIRDNADIDFIYLRGNHDNEDYFSDLDELPENLKFFDKDNWKSYEYEDDVVITGREFGKDNVKDSVYNEIVLDKNKVNILALHGEISKNTNKPDAPLFNLKKLENKDINYLALGHIHKYEEGKLGTRGKYCYPGCLEGRGFDETGDKGYVKITIKENNLITEFIPIARRKIHVVEVNITGLISYIDILDKIKETLADIPSSDLVKVELIGERTEDTEIEEDVFYDQIKNQFYFIKLEEKTVYKIDYEKYRNEISLKGEFIRTVEAENLTEQEKAEIIITGLKALSNREIH